jgi:hypothetical protein
MTMSFFTRRFFFAVADVAMVLPMMVVGVRVLDDQCGPSAEGVPGVYGALVVVDARGGDAFTFLAPLPGRRSFSCFFAL